MKTITIKTVSEQTYVVSKDDLLGYLALRGIIYMKEAKDISVTVTVPGGGDWSNCTLDIQDKNGSGDTALVVKWKEEVVENRLVKHY